MTPAKIEKARAFWKEVSPWLVGASLLGAGGAAAAKHFAAGDCCEPGASCCYPGSPCCKSGAHAKKAAGGESGGVAQR